MVNPIDSLLHKFKRETDHIDAIIQILMIIKQVLQRGRSPQPANCHDALRLKHILHVQYKDYNF